MTAWLSWQQQFGRRWVTQWAPYTPLHQCHRCGRRGSPVTVKQQPIGATCMRCWNRLRPLVAEQQALNEIAGLVRQLEKPRGHEDRRAA